MPEHELKTQIFYLNRIFEILSDGYMLSVILFNKTALKGNKDLPFSTINDDLKINLAVEEFEIVLDEIFTGLYNHVKMFTSAPKIFAQDWNNDFVLKSIEETKNNIIAYAASRRVLIKNSHHLAKDDFQVIEFVYQNKQEKEVLFFETYFH